MLDLPYRWCFVHNDMECPHEDDTPVHCFEIDESEDYSKCNVQNAVVFPKATSEPSRPKSAAELHADDVTVADAINELFRGG